ncbi:hypothetical protein KC640_03490, partial [Candidatus Dojkabacteria bacterium]|nr:hypothetical protein [Candidatus Dojkabacteria bacterium]
LVWLMSALLRSKISFRWWKRLHLLPYFVMPLIFVHSFGLANILQGGLRYYWYLLVVIALALSIYRLLTAAGLLKFYYQVVGVTDVTPNVKRFILAPLGGKVMSPQPGQFLYIQTKRFGETHPFTISHLDNQTGELSITAKSAGYFTQQLHKLKAGDRVFITGPYGVFTREAYTTKRQIALVAGGIGITPFLQIIERLHGGWDQQITLFYGNRTIGDIAFGDYLNDLVQEYPEQLKLVNVLSGEPDYEGETGFVSLELIQRYLTEQTNSYEYFVCGPQVMMDKVSSALLAAGVPKAQVHMEKFSL